MITKTRTAYKIGFSSALSEDTFSAYHEAGKYTWSETNKHTLRRHFFKGYASGRHFFTQVRRENLEATK